MGSSKMKAVFATTIYFLLTTANCDILCTEATFGCKYNTEMCIPIAWVCDGTEDCLDGSDEPDDHCVYNFDSSTKKPTMKPTTASSSRMTLKTLIGPKSVENCGIQDHHCDDKCVDKQWVCDGEPDCLDGSDEAGCEATRMPRPQKRPSSTMNPMSSSTRSTNIDPYTDTTTKTALSFESPPKTLEELAELASIVDPNFDPESAATQFQTEIPMTMTTTAKDRIPNELQMNCVLKCSNM